ncbi:interferon-inducible GTPase 5-like [Sinocyclocheilus grahami]|uniref:interferon-inducible GTPase 5-like n=1 Tax=Sinocyclocheilus grahami TaxID=75366 RepID=UPI0007AC6BF1|nr:PREDICTED: interferon-inducible GTPase 5-like [Sinocyclocheilus grahami]
MACGLYSRYFLIPKKDGGLRCILELTLLNRALAKRSFKMITVKQILAHIQPGDWFISVDLKDAYFHIEDRAYQFKVLPFGLALAPRTFMKCINAALTLLRQSGIRILNYLDDWLVIAQSQDTLENHKCQLLEHRKHLGLTVNMATSEEYCVITQEDLEDIKDTLSSQDLPSAITMIKEYLKKQNLVELNIGVTGESGSGKSTFVNAFRGLGDEEEGSAKTGVVETTTEPAVYLHPKYKNVKVWDLPGIGTPNFKADEYLKLVQFKRYDFFIIIASDRFRECHTQLATEIMKMGEKFYFVRSKIDFCITAEKRKKNFDQKKTLEIIREEGEI